MLTTRIWGNSWLHHQSRLTSSGHRMWLYVNDVITDKGVVQLKRFLNGKCLDCEKYISQSGIPEMTFMPMQLQENFKITITNIYFYIYILLYY